jgi:carboxyl-terminal processing protease
MAWKKMNRRFDEMLKRKGLWAAALIMGALLSVALLSFIYDRTVHAEEEYSELKIFTEVLSTVKANYVEEPNMKDLVYGAIKGMLSSLDPHSGFMPPDAYKEMQVDTKGEFGGIGIQIGMKDDVLTVIAPIEDTPAYKAGIQAGDKIVKINGESTRDMSIFDAVKNMRGPKDTTVTITIAREGWKDFKDFTIKRDIIQIKSIKAKMIDKDQGIGYVKLTQFQEKSAEELADALKNLNSQGMKSIILDLRNNPGGLLNSAVEVSSQFLPKDKLVVYIKGRSGGKTEYRSLAQFTSYADIPMIVLVNQGSASASEIVAGALKDWKRAVILGTQTFGKGSVQSVIPLSDGSGIRLTTARYYTPNDISIQNTGIKPDIEVKLAMEQARGGEAEGHKSFPVIREKDLKNHLDAAPGEKEDGKHEEIDINMANLKEEDDTQLQRAIDILKTWSVFKGFQQMKAAS